MFVFNGENKPNKKFGHGLIIGGLVGLGVCLILGAVLINAVKNIEFINENQKQEDISSQEQMINEAEENIDRGTQLFGTKTKSNGNITSSKGEYEFFNNVKMFGFEGKFKLASTHQAESDGTFVINMLRWKSDLDMNQDDYGELMSVMEEMYGDEHELITYEGVDDTTYWKSVNGFTWVTCWRDAEGNAEIRWVE